MKQASFNAPSIVYRLFGSCLFNTCNSVTILNCKFSGPLFTAFKSSEHCRVEKFCRFVDHAVNISKN